MNKHTQASQQFVERYLERAWVKSDGLAEKDVKKAEARLGVALPSALRSFYLSVGAVTDLCSIHNVIFHPRDLIFEGDYLLFWTRTRAS